MVQQPVELQKNESLEHFSYLLKSALRRVCWCRSYAGLSTSFVVSKWAVVCNPQASHSLDTQLTARIERGVLEVRQLETSALMMRQRELWRGTMEDLNKCIYLLRQEQYYLEQQSVNISVGQPL